MVAAASQAGGGLPSLRLANADFVTDRIAVGGDLSPNFRRARAQLDELVAAGITHIADLRSEWTDEALVAEWAPQLAYLHHPVADAGQVIDAEWFSGLVEWATAALADPDARLLVHCHMGVNRAPSAALALLLAQGMDLRSSLDAIRARRPVAIIDYARSALDWHLAASGANAKARRNARRRLGRWRGANQLDMVTVIRAIRDTETPPNRWLLRLEADLLAELVELRAGLADAAIGLVVESDPEELSQLDQVLLATADGLVGRALVVGPVQHTSGHRVLPLLVESLVDPVSVKLPLRYASWRRGAGPNLRLLPEDDYRKLAPTGRPVNPAEPD